MHQKSCREASSPIKPPASRANKTRTITRTRNSLSKTSAPERFCNFECTIKRRFFQNSTAAANQAKGHRNHHLLRVGRILQGRERNGQGEKGFCSIPQALPTSHHELNEILCPC